MITRLNNRSFGDNQIVRSNNLVDRYLQFPYKPLWWVHPLSGITKDGSDNVSQWDDASGNGNHLVQATGGNQPKWTAGELNGYAGVVFGTTDYMQTAGNVTGSGGAFTLFILVSCASHNSWDCMFTIKDHTVLWVARNMAVTTAPNLFCPLFTTPGRLMMNDVDGYELIIVTRVANGLVSLYWGNQVIYTESLATFSDDKIGIGTATFARMGGVVEELMFPVVMSKKHIHHIIHYFANKYGI